MKDLDTRAWSTYEESEGRNGRTRDTLVLTTFRVPKPLSQVGGKAAPDVITVGLYYCDA